MDILTKLSEAVDEDKKKEENSSENPMKESSEPESEEVTETPVEEAGEPAPNGSVDPFAVMDFFSKPGKITDSDFHAFCEQGGFDVHQAEAVAYTLAQKFMNLLRGGKGAGLDPNSVDPQQLEMGMKIESEHSDCPCIQKKIALDHISEKPDYYSQEMFQQEAQSEGQQFPDQEAAYQKTAACLRKIFKGSKK